MPEVVFLHRVRMTRLRSGERFPVVLDERGIPVLSAAFYLTRKRDQAVATLDSKARTLAKVHDFLRCRDICLAQRITQGLVLMQHEVDALRDYLRKVGQRTSRLRDKSHPRGKHVGATEWSSRCYRAADYLSWYINALLQQTAVEPLLRTEVRRELERLVFDLVAIKPSPTADQPSLPRAEQDKLVEAILPNSALNPFSPSLQFRNYCILLTYLEMGIRRSELLNLRCDDLLAAGPSLKLVRRPDDPAETRSRPPSVKTMPREIPISPGLYGALAEYITNDRARVEQLLKRRNDADGVRRFRNNPYLFVSSNGDPLSASSVQKIFETLRLKVDALPATLSPHMLRRAWNDNFSDYTKGRIPDHMATWVRDHLMGWRPGGPQSQHYAKRFVSRLANEAILERQTSLLRATKRI